MLLKTFLILASSLNFLTGDPIIQLENGLILGRKAVTIHNKEFYAFEGVPYAAPPVGPLRFKEPQSPQNWSGILNTTYLDTYCFQTSGNSDFESEDCLYINIYTPQLNFANLPVVVFIYGGGFDDGYSQKYNSPDLFLEEGVILVTFNYRVGIFGFLSTQDDVILGNNGLKDQHFALKWTRNNIQNFGGDPGKITVFGQSAGAASLCYQLLNPKSEGLFQRAVLASGSCLSPWAYQRNSREIAFKTAALLNSTFEKNNDSKHLLEFLQRVDAKDLDFAAYLYKISAYTPGNLEISQGFFWAPVIEVGSPDSFITEKMYGLLKNGNFVKVPTLIGITSEESLLFNLIPLIFKLTMMSYDENLSWLVPNNMGIQDDSKKKEMGLLIKNIYTNESLSDNLGDGIRYSSDTSFTRSVIKHAEFVSRLSETYFYQFSYHGKMGYIDIHYDGAETVAHGEDTYYLFCSSLQCDETNYPESDGVTRKRLLKIYTDFAKYGNPTPEPSQLLQNISWPLFSEQKPYYLDIGENLEIRIGPKSDTCGAWKQLYDSLGYDDFDTY